MSRTLIGVFPAAELASKRRLFAALEALFNVRFTGRREGEWRDLDAAILVRGADNALDDPSVTGLPTFIAASPTPATPQTSRQEIEFGFADGVDERLRGKVLCENALPAGLPALPHDGEALAMGQSGPVWTINRGRGRAVSHHVCVAPVELRPGERLKDHLTAGRFLSLLPLVHFLRTTCEPGWERPPLRASFILDDPNLHWRSYGYLRYPDLVDNAARHGYHVGIAMVPLDAAFAHSPTVRLVRSSPHLSLLVHGNDHVKRELAHPMPQREACALLTQAMRRMAAFERRTAIPVCRVMVPPHYDCSEQMMLAMLQTGFEAVCYTGPVDSPGDPLTGWAPADLHFGGGFPGLHRLPFDASVDELVLRAFLDHPILLYGHHTDLARDVGVLSDAAERVNRLGDVEWMSTTEICRSNFFMRPGGDGLHVLPFSRHVRVAPPSGIDRIHVESPWPGLNTEQEHQRVAITSDDEKLGCGAGDAVGGTGAPVSSVIEIVVRARLEPAIPPMPIPAWRPWPVLRRCLTEARDRVFPLFAIEWSQRQQDGPLQGERSRASDERGVPHRGAG